MPLVLNSINPVGFPEMIQSVLDDPLSATTIMVVLFWFISLPEPLK
ncbi:hypothetical protein ADIARSV_2869 [Arcticibacter svalbardensis MN12-7]|uniref:Uncharacterized protein n=1 Tax=Arcticibacter svalbardensis MN12-7 TaxID=1150600 RepID=R9GR56_9SPHI|nr:hypothetical protein ADIARSV_2869 [Arcticibacter svalbardensis MN12-7]